MPPSKKTPQSLNEEFAQEKKKVKKSIQNLHNSRRNVVKKRAERVVESQAVTAGNPEWASLTIAHKLELVMSWSINGGNLMGERYSRHRLGVALGLSDSEVHELIAKCERDFLRIYDSAGELSKLVSKTVTRLHYQLIEDRGRLTSYCEVLERERKVCLQELQAAKAMPKGNKEQSRARYLAISRFWQVYIDLTNQQFLAASALNEHTKSSIKFIEVFKSSQDGDNSGDEAAREKQKPLTKEAAFKLVEEISAQILPSQEINEVHRGSRDPDAAFKELSSTDK